jgi:hypothetical protein
MADAAVLLLSQVPWIYGKTGALGGVDEMDIPRFEHGRATLLSRFASSRGVVFRDDIVMLRRRPGNAVSTVRRWYQAHRHLLFTIHNLRQLRPFCSPTSLLQVFRQTRSLSPCGVNSVGWNTDDLDPLIHCQVTSKLGLRKILQPNFQAYTRKLRLLRHSQSLDSSLPCTVLKIGCQR